jgi:hypothetical protein
MKNIKEIIFAQLIIILSSITLNAQDFVVQPDGIRIEGKVISASGNNLSIKSTDGDLLPFKIDELSEVFIKDPTFNDGRLSLTNTRYSKDKNGIKIQMLDNPVRIKTTKSKSYAASTSIGIDSDDVSPKTKVIFDCNDCSQNGHLEMKSQDRKSSLDWDFKTYIGNVFPHSFDMDANKTYTFKYKDKAKGEIEKTIKVPAGKEFRVNVFE